MLNAKIYRKPDPWYQHTQLNDSKNCSFYSGFDSLMFNCFYDVDIEIMIRRRLPMLVLRCMILFKALENVKNIFDFFFECYFSDLIKLSSHFYNKPSLHLSG